MRLLHEIAIFQTVKSKVIISMFETVRLSVSSSLRNLYSSLNSIKENYFLIELTYVIHGSYQEVTKVPFVKVLNKYGGVLICRGWSGGAMGLDKLYVPGRLTYLNNRRTGAYCACSRCG